MAIVLFRETNLFAVAKGDSLFERIIQPKFDAGLVIQLWTSLIAPAPLSTRAVLVLIPEPTVGIDAEILASKSPPAVVQAVEGNMRWVQVASFVVAGEPAPSEEEASEVPSPQSAVTLCISIPVAVAPVLFTVTVSEAAVITAPAGIPLRLK